MAKNKKRIEKSVRFCFYGEVIMKPILDPPHLINCGKTSDMAKSYGVLEKEWHAGMKAIFDEAWRVLKPYGTLIFKWADKDVSLAELLYVLEREPLFGDKKPAANKAGTNRFFLVFFKDE